MVICSLPQSKLEQCITRISVNMNVRSLLCDIIKWHFTCIEETSQFWLAVPTHQCVFAPCRYCWCWFFFFHFSSKRNKKKRIVQNAQSIASVNAIVFSSETQKIEQKKKTNLSSFWLYTASFFHFYVNHYPKPICHLSGKMSSWIYKRNVFSVVEKEK